MNLKESVDKLKLRKHGWLGLIIMAFTVFIAVFLYLDRRNQISSIILSLGAFGVVVAILLMSVVCMTPMPSEGLMVLFLKVYGVYWGTVFAWLGSNLSTVVIFVIARYYGQRLMQKLVTPARFKLIDNWVKRKGTGGLFVARLLPVPAFAVNYVAGTIPSIRFWPYLWTAAISIIPYYVGTSLVFLGIAKEVWHWLIVGGAAIIAFWSAGYLLNRRRFE